MPTMTADIETAGSTKDSNNVQTVSLSHHTTVSEGRPSGILKKKLFS